jgi:hypothetical protein
MAIVTFNGENLIIQLTTTGLYDVESDLYSAWKDWVVLSDNSKFPVAFETTGGDDIGGGQQIAPYFFCRNDIGWRIKSPPDNGEVIIQGNLFPRLNSNPLFIESVGFDAFIRQEVSTRAVVVEVGTSGVSEQDKQDIAALVIASGLASQDKQDIADLSAVSVWNHTQ